MSGETSFCLNLFCVACLALGWNCLLHGWATRKDAEKDRRYRLALYALRDYWEGRALNIRKPESAERKENAGK